MSKKPEKKPTGHKGPWAPIAMFAVTVLSYIGISTFAPTFGAGEIPTIGFLGEGGTLVAMRAILCFAMGLVAYLFVGALTWPRLNIDKSKIPPYPRMGPLPDRKGKDKGGNSAKSRRIPVPTPVEADNRKATFTLSKTDDGLTQVNVKAVGMSGSRFKKLLRNKIIKIAGVEWAAMKNDPAKETVTLSGVIQKGVDEDAVFQALEKLAKPAEKDFLPGSDG